MEIQTSVVSIHLDKNFYTSLKKKNNYDEATEQTIINTVTNLKEISTTSNKPGMLLGKIQSGKTRSFIGIMGLAFDNDYEVVVVLTKNSNALVKQTLERLDKEFETVIEDGELDVFDVMYLPNNLSKFELNKKIVIVVKKEKKNMERLSNAFFTIYPALKERKILFVDDEADFASVAYENDKQKNIVDLKVIAGQIDELRAELVDTSYLQVTATPYSLYLQPEDMSVHENKSYQPKRPAFTELVPVHDRYVGGEMYFENSKIEGHMASYIFHEIAQEELGILKKQDKRKVKVGNLLIGERYQGIRAALVNFIVGGCIRNLQQKHNNEKQKFYSFIIHTMTSKSAHQWQDTILTDIKEKLEEALNKNDPIFQKLIQEAYDDLSRSKETTTYFPPFNDLFDKVCDSLKNGELLTEIVNSEKEVNNLLDKSGQLKLRTPLNIFIGGQILDRGITIGNLIGFYYGRDPKKFQQDTVLQHSRMYGARPQEDVAVTRFYTTQRIYDVMARMHEFDSELRQAFENGRNQGVVFIHKDTGNKIIPCSPNKIMISSINMLKPFKRLTPFGFNTLSKTKMLPKMKKLDLFVEQLREQAEVVHPSDPNCFLISLEDAIAMLEGIYPTLEMHDGYDWDLDMYKALLIYMSKEEESANKGRVWMIVRKNRDLGRVRESGRIEDSPATTKDELTLARQVAINCPAIILTRQNGKEEKGWRDAEFYWPVVIAPANIPTTVFANKEMK